VLLVFFEKIVKIAKVYHCENRCRIPAPRPRDVIHTYYYKTLSFCLSYK